MTLKPLTKHLEHIFQSFAVNINTLCEAIYLLLIYLSQPGKKLSKNNAFFKKKNYTKLRKRR